MIDKELFLTTDIPEPLPKNELEEYLKRISCGDKVARDIVIVHNIRLVFNRIYNKFKNVSFESKELVSIGIIGLIKAVDTFDFDRNIQFTTYASKCIDNEILCFLRTNKKHLNNISIYEEVFISALKDGSNMTLEETLVDRNVDIVFDYEQKEENIYIRKLVEQLEGRDREIIKLYFGFYDDRKYNQREIAEIFNLSQAHVSKLITKSVKSLRKKFK